MTDSDKFQETVKRLLRTPHKPHDEMKSVRPPRRERDERDADPDSEG